METNNDNSYDCTHDELSKNSPSAGNNNDAGASHEQQAMNLTRSMLALLLLCVAGMFAFVGAPANEPAAQKTATGKTGNVFRDCPDCPEMVMLPQGRFVMGAPPGEEERENVMDYFRGHSVPQHLVTIRYRLAIAKFDVTTCLAMSGNGLEIAGTTTIRVRSLTVVLGKAGSVVGALCAAAPYSNIPGLVRAAVRNRPKSSGRDHSGGFRVARTLP